ncbi:MAG TPA: 30S ribosomal protein S16 [Candidatus Saccharimonadia bacterium]
MLVIRLARTGRAKYPTYRIVAAESARAATGKFVSVLGHYNPHTKELVIKQDEIKQYLSNGAQPSNTVVKLLQREKVELPQWVKLKTKTPKVTEAPAEEAKPEAPQVEAATEAAEAVADEDVRVAEVAEDTAAAQEGNAPDADSTEIA